jgi:branched-chain amino acid transport system substrate-binding protein
MRKSTFAQIGFIVIGVSSILLTITITIPMAQQKVITKEVAFYTDFTGPFPDTGRDVKNAGDLWKRWINDVRGGIEGVKVECIYYDTKYQAPRGISIHESVATQKNKPICIYGGISPVNEAIKDRLPKDEIPVLLFAATLPEIQPPGWEFSHRPRYAEEYAGFVAYQLSIWKENRPMKVAFMMVDSPGGRELQRLKPFLLSKKVELTTEEFFPFAPVDVTPQISRIIAGNPDFVLTVHTLPGASLLVKELDKRGMLSKMPVCVTLHHSITDLVGVLGPEICNKGIYEATALTAPHDMEAPKIKLFWELRQKYMPDAKINGTMLTTWGPLLVLTEAMGRAARKGIIDKMDGRAIYNELNDGKFDTGGVTAPLRFTPKQRVGTNMIRVTKCVDGKAVPFSPWIESPTIE